LLSFLEHSAVLTSCGWAGKQSIDVVMGECEDIGEYERAAALAVWHGDIGSAVDVLQRGSNFIRRQVSNTDDETALQQRMSVNYAQLLELVSLSIAGYRGGDEKASSLVWRKSCMCVLQRPELLESNDVSENSSYLRHILKFLVSIGIDDSHQEVLEDNTLSLSERVAFACRFLSRPNLKIILEKFVGECQRNGNIEGIIITGIEKEGIDILQCYVDRTADVQTGALLTSRVILPLEWIKERRITAEWLQSYRSLLNTWQMWQSRAIFDVDRAQLLRKFKQRITDATPTNGKVGISIPGRRAIASRRNSRGSDPDVQASIPAQLDARCNYCSAPLGLRKQDNQPNQWLSKMKNVLSCCPTCRKPLPRCAICMLPLGALNPYTELTKERSRVVRPGSTMSNDDLSSLPFAEWFTWCVRCKHGGHAHHMVGWFNKHNVCPVSGCSCNCQFDATPKINRSAQRSNIQQKQCATSSTPPLTV
jgi:WD repeat-containing protein mio